MAGVAIHPNGRSPRGPRRRSALAAAGLALCALLLAERSASPSDAVAAKQTCPAPPSGLAPPGSPANRFTMMIRINTDGNVNTWTKPDGGMGGRVQPHDI